MGTDTYELNRNLILTDGARADSVPNLEIETGEVVGADTPARPGARRRAAVLSPVAWHSRGRGPCLVVRGFFADIVAQIGVPELQERLVAAVEHELEQAAGAAA